MIRNNRTARTVQNAISLMRALSEAGHPMGVSELSEALGIGKSTAHLLLGTLTSEGFTDRVPGSTKYRLGLGLFEVGAAAVEHLGYGQRLSPMLERLADETEEAVSLAVCNGDSALFVQRFESAHILRTDIRPGTRVPLHGSASGKVLLAAMTDEEIDELYPSEKLPPSATKTIRLKNDLKLELENIRERGWSAAVDEYVDGVSAIATGVRDQTRRVVAALSLAGPTVRFDVHKWVNRLLEVGGEVSNILGYLPLQAVASNGRRGARGLARKSQTDTGDRVHR